MVQLLCLDHSSDGQPFDSSGVSAHKRYLMFYLLLDFDAYCRRHSSPSPCTPSASLAAQFGRTFNIPDPFQKVLRALWLLDHQPHKSQATEEVARDATRACDQFVVSDTAVVLEWGSGVLRTLYALGYPLEALRVLRALEKAEEASISGGGDGSGEEDVLLRIEVLLENRLFQEALHRAVRFCWGFFFPFFFSSALLFSCLFVCLFVCI